MLFCNPTPLDGRFVNAIIFCRKSEFCEYITFLHIQHSTYVRCNVSFAVQYSITAYYTDGGCRR